MPKKPKSKKELKRLATLKAWKKEADRLNRQIAKQTAKRDAATASLAAAELRLTVLADRLTAHS